MGAGELLDRAAQPDPSNEAAGGVLLGVVRKRDAVDCVPRTAVTDARSPWPLSWSRRRWCGRFPLRSSRRCLVAHVRAFKSAT
jgi:hypothetical protein